MNYCHFGAEVLIKLLQTIESQVDGVEKSDDIEYIHKMRVTSRRIRAAMPLFKECFSKKSYRKWLNEIKKVTKFLGNARDIDVQILVIKDFIAQLQPTESKTGIEFLLERHIKQRSSLQPNIIRGLRELSKSKVLEQMTSNCNQIIEASTKPSFDLYAVRERAFWQISPKLDDFLSMEDYVHQENAILKHHEMRIRAKWLRYTMESFAGLYPDELSEEINATKNFQDTLGEMHDCDVWIERIPLFMEELKKEIPITQENKKAVAERNKGLVKFLDDIKKKRKKYYTSFVSFWDEKKKANAFEELRKKASADFIVAEQRIKAELENPFVRIGVISDIHANLNALDAVMKDAEHRGITVFLNAGDTIGLGVHPNEVLQTLYSKNVLSVIGNFDLEVLDRNSIKKGPKKFSLEYGRKILSKAYETYLRTFPSRREFDIAHKKLLILHGTPESIEEHLYHNTPDDRFQELAKMANADVIVSGHTHDQFTKEVGGCFFISPGSVGRPGDGNPQAAYTSITINPFSVESIRVSYKVEKEANAIRKSGAPESYAQMLLKGISLGRIISEDRIRKGDMEEKCPLMVQNSLEVAGKYCHDLRHAKQVRKLALELFDSLKKIHALGNRERCWLECSAILHDIGLTKGTNGHNKNSMKLILNDTEFQFTSIERRIIANIARYHNKCGPKNNHYNFAPLSRQLKHKVTILASILRLADGLDFSHRSIVQKVEADASIESIKIEGVVNLNPILEEYAINKKKDLFEKSFKKRVVLTWKLIQPAQ